MTNSHRSRPGDDKVMMMYMEEGVKRKKKKKNRKVGQAEILAWAALHF